MKTLRLAGWPALALGVLSIGLMDCGSDAVGALQGCNGLNVSAKADATVKAFADAATQLETAAKALEAEWALTCNAINADLGLDTSKKDAAGACGVLNVRVADALKTGVTVTLDVNYSCKAEAKVQASCQGQCAASANCDIKAKCEPGKLAVECKGKCEGSCTAPSVACAGKCEGKCTAEEPVLACSGTCEGECEADFSGACGGVCEGKCDGQASTAGGSDGNCAGKCEGKCTAKASGQCGGSCKGSCTASGGVECKGTCDGSCTVTQGECSGTCHGTCAAEVSPPYCEGKLDCQVDANCQASCDGQASASVKCGGATNVVVTGDAKLYAAIVKHQAKIAAAFGATLELKDPIANLASKVGGAIQGMADITAAGTTCMVSSLSATARAQASISVSVNASASIKGEGSASGGTSGGADSGAPSN